MLLVVLLTLPEEHPTRQARRGPRHRLRRRAGGVGRLAWHRPRRARRQRGLPRGGDLYGIGFPYLRRYLATGGLAIAVLAFGQLAMGTLQLALVLPFAGGVPPAFALGPLAAASALGAIGTGAAYLLNYSIIRDAGATSASTVTYLVPVFATIAGVALLGERLTWNEPVGGLLVLLGVAASQGRLGWGVLRASSASA